MIDTKFVYEGNRIGLRYFSKTDVAAREGGLAKQFQELPLLERIREMALGGFYLDCGANIGNHSTYFSKFCSAERVISIEAHPRIFGVLSFNIQKNVGPLMKEGNLLFNTALGAPGKRWVYMSKIPPDNAGRTHVVDHPEHAGVKVACTTIDELLSDSLLSETDQGVGLMKLDIEGCELDALKGAENTIRLYHPVIVAEHQTKIQLEAVQELLRPLNYNLDPTKYEPHGWTRIWIPQTLYNR